MLQFRFVLCKFFHIVTKLHVDSSVPTSRPPYWRPGWSADWIKCKQARERAFPTLWIMTDTDWREGRGGKHMHQTLLKKEVKKKSTSLLFTFGVSPARIYTILHIFTCQPVWTPYWFPNLTEHKRRKGEGLGESHHYPENGWYGGSPPTTGTRDPRP